MVSQVVATHCVLIQLCVRFVAVVGVVRETSSAAVKSLVESILKCVKSIFQIIIVWFRDGIRSTTIFFRPKAGPTSIIVNFKFETLGKTFAGRNEYDMASKLEQRFVAAVNVIRGLPKEGEHLDMFFFFTI